MDIIDNPFSQNKNNPPGEIEEAEKFGIIEKEEKKNNKTKNERIRKKENKDRFRVSAIYQTEY